MTQPFFNLSMDKLNDLGSIATLDGKIVLNDNLNNQEPPASETKERIQKDQIKFSTVIIALFCVNGWIDIDINLEKYHIKKNDVIIITSKQICKLCEISRDMRFFIVAISNDFYDPLLNRTNSVKQQNLLAHYPHQHLESKDIKNFSLLYNLMKENIHHAQASFQWEILKGYVHAFFFKIFSLLLVNQEEREDKEQHTEICKQQDIYKRFIDAVQEHYTQERSIKYYADLLCISPKYLSQIVYKVSGRFATDHINDHVILEAKALIKSRKYSMQEISEMLNFSTQSFFGRFFKAATGYTPVQYQNKQE